MREEAGVRGRIVCPLGLSVYQIKENDLNKEIRVKFYLMEKLLDLAAREDRGARWFEYTDAKNQLTHDESKEILAWAEMCRAGKRMQHGQD